MQYAEGVVIDEIILFKGAQNYFFPVLPDIFQSIQPDAAGFGKQIFESGCERVMVEKYPEIFQDLCFSGHRYVVLWPVNKQAISL